jgi:hypothetical protein
MIFERNQQIPLVLCDRCDRPALERKLFIEDNNV